MFSNVYYDASKNKIYLWEYINNQRILIEEDYQPYCFIYDSKGEYKDLYGKSCKIKTFENYYKQRDFLDKLETLEGDINPEDRILIDRYHKIKEFDNPPELDIHYLDIETSSEGGFPSSNNPKDEILLISIYSTKLKKFQVFGTYDYTSTSKIVNYEWCNDETELLKKYFNWHRENYPDIISGWNSLRFDIPYILNRAKYVLPEIFVKKYSPIGIIRERKIEDNTIYDIAGISQLDYMELYKTFSINERESYRLDYIAQTELNQGKVKFDGDLNSLWKTDWKKFVLYNINDTLLIKKLEDKLGYIKLVQAQSYMCRVPFEKYSSSIKKFDNYLMSILKEKKIVLPTGKHHKLEGELPGGYVAEPKVGYYEKVISYDFTSLYPHIIMALNISPDTYVGKIESTKNGIEFTEFDISFIQDYSEYMIKGKTTNGLKLKEFILKNNLLISPNGSLYKSQTGFLPGIIKEIFNKRKIYKNKMKDAEKLYQQTKDEKYSIQKSVNDSMQYATKILANSAYGIMANPHYRLFSLDNASSITLMGQKLAKYTGKEINNHFKELYNLKKDINVYQDTDSVYLDYSEIITNTKSDIEFINSVNHISESQMYPFLDKIFTHFNELHNISQNYFDLKREKICVGAIFLQKKKYALYVIDSEGLTYDKPEVKVTGLEIVRSSTPSFCREKIKDIVEDLFRTRCSDKNFIVGKLKNIKKEFKKTNLSEIAFPRGIKGLNEYIDKNGKTVKGIPIHFRASFNFNQLLLSKDLRNKYEQIHNNDKIKFIYLNENNPIRENIIAFKEELPKEFELEKYVDLETQFDKSFMSPIKNIVKALNWELNLEDNDISDLF